MRESDRVVALADPEGGAEPRPEEQPATRRKAPCLAEGKRVRITPGPFRDMIGVVLESRKQCRVVLNVTSVCQSVLLEVNAEDLELLP